MKTYQKPTLIQDLGMKPINSIRKDTGNRANKRFGKFKCFCGKIFEAQINSRQKSCGCYIKTFSPNTTHGGTNTRLYRIWSGIKTRVFNKNRKCSKNYVNRGIKICREWENDFATFKIWAENNGYSSELTIDRINNDGNYEPSNCQWATRTEQMQNTRLLFITNTSGYRGASKCSKGNKWVARVSIENKKITIGTFNTAKEAGQAFDTYVLENNISRPLNNIKQS